MFVGRKALGVLFLRHNYTPAAIMFRGSAASFHLRGVPLCCAIEREVGEERRVQFGGESRVSDKIFIRCV